MDKDTSCFMFRPCSHLRNCILFGDELVIKFILLSSGSVSEHIACLYRCLGLGLQLDIA